MDLSLFWPASKFHYQHIYKSQATSTQLKFLKDYHCDRFAKSIQLCKKCALGKICKFFRMCSTHEVWNSNAGSVCETNFGLDSGFWGGATTLHHTQNLREKFRICHGLWQVKHIVVIKSIGEMESTTYPQYLISLGTLLDEIEFFFIPYQLPHIFQPNIVWHVAPSLNLFYFMWAHLRHFSILEVW